MGERAEVHGKRKHNHQRRQVKDWELMLSVKLAVSTGLLRAQRRGTGKAWGTFPSIRASYLQGKDCHCSQRHRPCARFLTLLTPLPPTPLRSLPRCNLCLTFLTPTFLRSCLSLFLPRLARVLFQDSEASHLYELCP